MKDIEYSITNIEEIKQIFDKNNSLIIEKLKVLEKEYDNMSEVLNTPNSSKIMPELYNMIKQYDDTVTNKGVYFGDLFKTVIFEYDQFVNELAREVGGTNNGN